MSLTETSDHQPEVQDKAMIAWQQLNRRMHPADLAAAAGWRMHYQAKYRLAFERRPQRICEIGVRAGYSAYMFLQACPNAYVLGIDNDSSTHGGVPGMVQFARDLLAERNFALLIYDSQKLDALPGQFDLVHVDGDHTYAGTYHDLKLAWNAAPTILVDDYGSIPEVKRAVDDFAGCEKFERVQVDDKQLLLIRSNHPSSVKLSIDGQVTVVNAEYTFRFLQHPDRPATPVMYFRGRRVTASWSLDISHHEPADPWGCSG